MEAENKNQKKNLLSRVMSGLDGLYDGYSNSSVFAVQKPVWPVSVPSFPTNHAISSLWEERRERVVNAWGGKKIDRADFSSPGATLPRLELTDTSVTATHTGRPTTKTRICGAASPSSSSDKQLLIIEFYRRFVRSFIQRKKRMSRAGMQEGKACNPCKLCTTTQKKRKKTETGLKRLQATTMMKLMVVLVGMVVVMASNTSQQGHHS